MLEVAGLRVAHGAVVAVRDVSLRVGEGELATLLGANGAGKSSTLLAIAGALPAAGGCIRLNGVDVTAAKPERMVRLGVSMVPETRDVFPDLTVEENLKLGAYVRLSDAAGVAADRKRMAELFPRLRDRGNQPAGTLSGGEPADAGDRAGHDVAPAPVVARRTLARLGAEHRRANFRDDR